jgi:ABC-type polysaccharide/polyol phosphate transport system ATPase subunit
MADRSNDVVPTEGGPNALAPLAPRTTANAITVRNVSKKFRLYNDRNQSLKATISRGRRARYEDFQALDDVSLEIEQGTTYGLIGENGSGKSTLLKCMARILRPEQGSIEVVGKVSALLELGAGFHPELSGRENVYLNAAILGLSGKEVTRKFDDIVEFAGLEQFIDSPVKNYSSGMYVRLGFSVAINVDPDVLLVDEVLAVGDEQFQRRCNEKFSELRERGKTIVVVSHGMSAMRTICDRVAWLEHGVLQQVGDAGEVIDSYIAEVQTDRQEVADDDGLGARWGSGEAVIEQVELVGTGARPTTRVNTGDPVTVRIHFDAHEPVERPVFGFAIFTLEGQLITGPNTREAGLECDRIDGKGVVELTIPRMMLLPGTYDISVSLYDHAITHPYDFRQKVLRFDVEVGTPHETFGGIVSLDGRWSVTSNGARSDR